MRYVPHPYKRVLLYAAILLVGYSRVFLFQHFVADIFAGVLLGLLCVMGGDWISNQIFHKNRLEIDG
jgi:membrane-associated phospholipid phosphatase